MVKKGVGDRSAERTSLRLTLTGVLFSAVAAALGVLDSGRSHASRVLAAIVLVACVSVAVFAGLRLLRLSTSTGNEG